MMFGKRKGPVFLVTPYAFPGDASHCVIVDIDGTLSDPRHREHYLDKTPRDWEGFFSEMHKDPCFEEVSFLTRAIMSGTSTHVILATARPSNYSRETMRWLKDKRVHYNHIVMRREGDKRDDTIVKAEMCDAIQKHYTIKLVIDDRPEVVDMWRARGLRVLQPDASRWKR